MTKHLCERLQRSIEFLQYEDITGVESLVVSGGVASNLFIRRGLETVARHYNMSAIFPPPALCTDNGVMVAWNGLERWRKGRGVVAWEDCLQVRPLHLIIGHRFLAASNISNISNISNVSNQI